MADLAQYAIDIAARLTGQETFAELDRLTSTLSGAGKGAEHFQTAIATLSGQLQAAGDANAAAQEKLASGQTRYRELEVALDRVSRAAERAGKKNGGVVPFELAAEVAAAESALEAHAMTLEALEGDAKATAAAEKGLAAQLKGVQTMAGHVDKRLSMNSESLAKMQAGLSASGTGIGRLGASLIAPVKGFADLAQVVGRTNTVLLVTASIAAGVALAVAALAAAAVAAGGGLAVWAVGLADARRNTELAREGAEALHPELAALRGDVASISAGTGIAADKLRGMAGQLKAAKVAAADMPAALRAMATAEAAVEGGGAAFLEDLKRGKKSVADLAATAESKFGGIVAKKMIGLDAQAKRFKENIAGIFGGLNIEPVLAGLQTLVALFDENTATGRAMKAVFEGVFQPLIDSAQLAAWVIEAFALGIGIGVLKAYRAVKPGVDAIAKALDIDTSGFDLEATLAGVSKAAEYLAPVLLAIGAVIGGVVLVIGGLAAALAAVSFGTVAAAAAALGGTLYGLWTAVQTVGQVLSTVGGAVVGAFSGAFSAAGQALSAFAGTLTGLGGAMIDGLIAGITGGAGRVASSITGVVSGAVGAAKAALGIASPSKVMAAEVAEPMVAGAERGIDRGAERVQSALADMVAPPEAPAVVTPLQTLPAAQGAAAQAQGAAAQAQGAAAQAQGGPSFTFQGPINFYGVQDAPSGVESFAEMLTRALEGDALAMGAPA